jgi:hypothetical protein
LPTAVLPEPIGPTRKMFRASPMWGGYPSPAMPAPAGAPTRRPRNPTTPAIR